MLGMLKAVFLKAKACVASVVTSVRSYVVPAAIAVAVVAVGAGELLAQGGGATTVPFEPIVDFGSIFDTLKTYIAPLVATALGLGLAIWGAKYVFRIIKGMGR